MLPRLRCCSEENQRLATAAAQASKDAEAAREALLRVQNKCADEIAAVTAQAQKDAEQARADAHNDSMVVIHQAHVMTVLLGHKSPTICCRDTRDRKDTGASTTYGGHGQYAPTAYHTP